MRRAPRARRPSAGGAGGRLAALPGLGAQQCAEPGRPRACRARRARIRPGARAARALPGGAHPRSARRAARRGSRSALPRPGLLQGPAARPAPCAGSPPPSGFIPLRLQSVPLSITSCAAPLLQRLADALTRHWLAPPWLTRCALRRTCAPRAPGLVRLCALAQRGGRQRPRGGRGGAGARAAGGRPGAVLAPLAPAFLLVPSGICVCVARAAARCPLQLGWDHPGHWSLGSLCFRRKAGAGQGTVDLAHERRPPAVCK